MALVTRCPNCATTFRVTPFHLQAHGGEVRCGHCARIFNGFAALATMREPEAADSGGAKSDSEAEETPPHFPEIPSESAAPAQVLSDQKDSPSVSGHKIIQDEAAADQIGEEAQVSERPVSEESISKTAGTARNSSAAASAGEDKSAPEISETIDPWAENDVLSNYPPEYYAFDEGQPHGASLAASLAWGLASLFLIVVLAAQAIYAYRGELAVIAPDAKPYLERYCELLECTIPAPQYAKLLNIESSEMQADTEQPGVITLNATVRNHAPYPQAFPSFQLTLIDTQNRPLASRTFPPAAYLEEKENHGSGVAPNEEFNVKLHLDSGDLNAAGYRLLLLYPQS
ncbi:zinc-ribbon and DUF3426 domain-containing protein [Nitrosovibrio sp. Nv6]|uniref:zinc-ribbon and DUF3426 domain-containing protein n=1 Tax=Nitrosovibrio sp. Nv6 TaxID=1855340 RepID=UPI0008CEAB01|nr:zinc-ribbon and DUF3426 domain-containing protein [Nitrosovibrio sp. Nv6]SEP40491.1 MJ0042 family finger-like domain-containing protein [Nitrosovibrio sp. Nv6]